MPLLKEFQETIGIELEGRRQVLFIRHCGCAARAPLLLPTTHLEFQYLLPPPIPPILDQGEQFVWLKSIWRYF